MTSNTTFTTPPPTAKYAILSFPTPEILLVTLNRPDQLNCINLDGHIELDAIWSWLDGEPSLRVGIVTGSGRAFCAGADLKEWNTNNTTGTRRSMPPSGFAALSRRSGKKPIIAAVNGLAYGGGMEAAVNCDIVVASSGASFALPEVKRGVVALAGALPRLVRTVGKQRAMEMALTGRTYGTSEMQRWGVVNEVVGDAEGKGKGVVQRAVEVAAEIAANSPDAVVVSREGVKLGWEGIGVEDGTRFMAESWYPRLVEGENIREGVRAFVEKRRPKWKASRL
ncbi:ClpP/crotonase [Viridothelium virens]|uniref:ClpP/crotonase n=1 Tax=Viridothelium virens TaxID=1048519 RepID=A0A6A6HGF2_VIRVR|nr:ClpP/crotonase [Viridothelium virens]